MPTKSRAEIVEFYLNRKTAADEVKQDELNTLIDRSRAKSTLLSEKTHMSKSAFFAGFRKAAAEERGSAPSGARFAGTFGAGVAAPIAALPLFNAGVKLDTKLTEQQAANFANSVRQARGIKTQVHHVMPKDMNSLYHPGLDTALVARRPSSGVLAHELGHAQSLGKAWQRGGLRRRMALGASLGGKASLLTTASMAASSNEKAQAAAPYVGAALAAPRVFEEAKASAHALRDLRKFRGTKAMLRAMPGLAGGLSTYLAAPAAAGYVAHKLRPARKSKELSHAPSTPT